MSNNTDTVLTQLAAEVNELEAQRTAGNQGKQIEMGHKLIAIRQILREVNGEYIHSTPALDGYSPNGWVRWLKSNLAISLTHAQVCIRSAIDPNCLVERVKGNHKRVYAPKGALRYARKAWPTWTHEQREQFSVGVLELLRSA